ncbi:helix-turn-helix transcriptional regulator [Limosilactobacillus reuteri]|uniref:helix-turn-helix transcriptional regulator n=1 Tax=Limosilactobacillus reuteri TaxID=1598 RepID=UPI0015DD66EE|nr:helix-turn-helix transcriptional regulator [Limosilactobacillus reuteri]QLL75795.1 helix-turn-helix domain-containing protein [Limosilactobacillus reuteri]
MAMTLKALRVNRGMDQAQAAKAVGVSKETWANYEKKKTFPTVPVIKKIETVFDISYNDIIFL